jgi:hypothetical protein
MNEKKTELQYKTSIRCLCKLAALVDPFAETIATIECESVCLADNEFKTVKAQHATIEYRLSVTHMTQQLPIVSPSQAR